MRLVPLLVLVAATGCGASSTGSLGQASAQPSLPSTRFVPAPTTAPTTASHASPAPASHTPSTWSARPSPTRTQAVVTATAGTATAGPGRISSAAASPSPRPTPSAVAGTVTVTDNDSGTTIRLAPGQHLRVRLSNGTWDPPQSSADRVVVRRSSTGGYPSNQPVDATFDAVGSGSADVTAQSDAACFHTQPRCMMAQREWRVSVVVS